MASSVGMSYEVLRASRRRLYVLAYANGRHGTKVVEENRENSVLGANIFPLRYSHIGTHDLHRLPTHHQARLLVDLPFQVLSVV